VHGQQLDTSFVRVCAAGLSRYPLYLQPNWFLASNASALRGRTRALCLELFEGQVSPRPLPKP
jgi:hypothetical protein